MKIRIASAVDSARTELAAFAECRTSEPGSGVWAGVGWGQDAGTGRGLFVEREGYSERFVRDQITASLDELQAARKLDLGPIEMTVIGATCTNAPIRALVLCAYVSEPWPDR